MTRGSGTKRTWLAAQFLWISVWPCLGLSPSGPIVVNGQTGTVIDGLKITSTAGDCIQIVNSTNITIRNSEIGPCGGNAVNITGGTGIAILDSYIHPETLSEGCCDHNDGILAIGPSNLLIQGNVIAYGESNIEIQGGNAVKIVGNFLLNPRGEQGGAALRGQNFQCGTTSATIGPCVNVVFENNYALSSLDTTTYLYPEATADSIRFANTKGILATGNYIEGGHSESGCGLNADKAANGVQFLSNALLDTGQCGIAVNDGTNQRVDSNKVLNRNPVVGAGNTAISVSQVYGVTGACSNVLVSNNIATEYLTDGSQSGFLNGKAPFDCAPLTLTSNIFGPAADSYLTPVDQAFPTPSIPPQPKDCVAASPYSTQAAWLPCGATLGPPVINSVVNGASFLPGNASGAFLTVFGSNLSATTRTWAGPDFNGDQLPLELDGVSVTVNGLPAYVAYVSLNQANVLVPDDPTIGQVEVQLTNAMGTSNAISANKAQFSPAFFTVSSTNAAALHADGVSIGPVAPAYRGETIMLFGTGFGLTKPPVPTGRIVRQAEPLANQVTVTIGGQPAHVTFAALTIAGEDQINVTIPDQLQDGNQALVASIGGAHTQPGIFILVQNGIPALVSLSPSSATSGGAGGALTITGANFVSGATATLNGVTHVTTFLSSTQLSIPLLPSDLATSGSYAVVVTNPFHGGSSNALFFSVTTPSAAAIPASFFGIHVSHGADDFPLPIKYGNYRNLASQQVWSNINSCPVSPATCQADPTQSVFDFSTLDSILAGVKSAGVNDVMFTLGFTPAWAAASISTSVNCSNLPTNCILPPDINPDGSGTNAIWDNWVRNIAAHVNNATWLETHAHVKYWEPWNEVFTDLSMSDCCSEQSSTGTYAQHLRLTEDTRCLTSGTGTIHNYPSAGFSTTCSEYLGAHGYQAIDSSAKIVMSSAAPGPFGDFELKFASNFLYCNDNPKKDLGQTTSCTWSGGLNWMSEAVDVINFHVYLQGFQPEQALPTGSAQNWPVAVKALLSAADKAKPLWNGEGSCGNPGPGHLWSEDNYGMAGFVPRFQALMWSAGFAVNMWYQYNYDQPSPWCPLANSGQILPAGTAFTTTYDWLVGSTPVNSPFCSNAGTIWTCPVTKANGAPAELIWDSQYGPGGTTQPANCTNSSNPTICGNTSYTVPSTYTRDWVDIQGNVHAFQPIVTLGAVPILLE
jgi:uncharacterized protein (TIGR03437 family)